MAKKFLTAEWRKLVMANYSIDPSVLSGLLPCKTELDRWNDTCYVSLVGFMFMNTKLKGISIPFHQNFEEVNLRFYVRHKGPDQPWKRGTVFIQELVPKPMITFVANSVYGEKYQTVPMKHTWVSQQNILTIDYHWEKKIWHHFSVTADNTTVPIAIGSLDEFITEHYWGYTKLSSTRTSEYGVEHPRWLGYPVQEYTVQADFGLLYGKAFEFLNKEVPKSVLLAEGSEIIVRQGKNL